MLDIQGAMLAVQEAWPGRSVCVGVDYWSMSYDGATEGTKPTWKVSVVPGNGDSKCDQWTGETLAYVVACALSAAPSVDLEMEARHTICERDN